MAQRTPTPDPDSFPGLHADTRAERAADATRVSDSAKRLAVALRKADSLANVRAVVWDHMARLWPSTEFFFTLFDRANHRFLMLLPDGSLVPKPASTFALDHFFTNPGSTHAYAEQLHTEPDLLGSLQDHSTPSGLTLHSLAVPLNRSGFLEAAIGIFSLKVFEWDNETVATLRELGLTMLQAIETSRRSETVARLPAPTSPRDVAEWERLHELLYFHDVLGRILVARLQPAEVVIAACRELGPFFNDYHFKIAVHYPESHIFVIHTPDAEPMRIPCDDAIEGYFLYRRDEDILAIEDSSLWTAPPPLNLGRYDSAEEFPSRLFAAGRVQANLVAVLGLESRKAVEWEAREVELLREAASGFGLAFYHAMLSDNLAYSCREANRQHEQARAEADRWRRRAEQLEAAAEIARSIAPRESVSALLDDLLRELGKRWPEARVSLQRHDEREGAFELHPPDPGESPQTRPVQSCIQNLFLNNVPVSHILCDSPQEIVYYRDLDPRFVSECEDSGYRSFCTAPILVEGRVWGTLTLQQRQPVGPPTADLLAMIAQQIAGPITATEFLQEAIRTDQA